MVLISSEFGDKARVGKLYYRVGKSRSDYKYGLLEWKKGEAA